MVDGRLVAGVRVSGTAFVDVDDADVRRKGLAASRPVGIRFETGRERVRSGGGGCVWAASSESAGVEVNEIARVSSTAESSSSSSSSTVLMGVEYGVSSGEFEEAARSHKRIRRPGHFVRGPNLLEDPPPRNLQPVPMH